MPELSLLTWALFAIAAVAVGLSKSAIPGVNTISIVIFAALLPAKESTGALLVTLMIGDIMAVWTYRRDANFKLLVRVLPPVLIGLVAGFGFLAIATDRQVAIGIGIILVSVICLGLFQRRAAIRRTAETVAAVTRAGEPTASRPAPTELVSQGERSQGESSPWGRRLQSLFYGSLGGFTTAVANAGGPVMSMYFLASRLSMTVFLGTSAWFFGVVNLVKLPFSINLGLVTSQALLLNLALAPAVVVGFIGGRRLLRHMSQQLFDNLVIVFTLAGGGYLLIRAFFFG